MDPQQNRWVSPSGKFEKVTKIENLVFTRLGPLAAVRCRNKGTAANPVPDFELKIFPLPPIPPPPFRSDPRPRPSESQIRTLAPALASDFGLKIGEFCSWGEKKLQRTKWRVWLGGCGGGVSLDPNSRPAKRSSKAHHD